MDGHVVDFSQVVLDVDEVVSYSAAADEAFVNVGGNQHVAMLGARLLEAEKSGLFQSLFGAFLNLIFKLALLLK